MSTAFESIKQGLQEAIAHAKGDERGVRVHRPRAVDVKAVRAKVGMIQEQFAARFGFSKVIERLAHDLGAAFPGAVAITCVLIFQRFPQRPWPDSPAKPSVHEPSPTDQRLTFF